MTASEKSLSFSTRFEFWKPYTDTGFKALCVSGKSLFFAGVFVFVSCKNTSNLADKGRVNVHGTTGPVLFESCDINIDSSLIIGACSRTESPSKR